MEKDTIYYSPPDTSRYKKFCVLSDHLFIDSSEYFWCSDCVCACPRSERCRKFTLTDHALEVAKKHNNPKIVRFQLYEDDWRDDWIDDYFIFIGGKYILCTDKKAKRHVKNYLRNLRNLLNKFLYNDVIGIIISYICGN